MRVQTPSTLAYPVFGRISHTVLGNMKNTAPNSWPLLGLVSLFCILAHFWYFRHFGFYEDDYWATTPFLDCSLGNIPHIVGNAFASWPQGRPLNHSLPMVQAILGMRLGGVPGIYLIGCLGLILNSWLVFLVSRNFLPTAGALICALFYILYPADTTRPYLVHTAHVQGSMTFFLLGAWLWCRGRAYRFASYPVAALSLAAYETAFIPFLTLPLLLATGFRDVMRRMLAHLAGCVVVVAVFASIRLGKGESRIAGALSDPAESLHRIVTSLYLGPVTSAKSTFLGAVQGWSLVDLTAAISALVATTLLVWIVTRQASVSKTAMTEPVKATGAHPGWIIFVAAFVWSSVYALTLTNYPPTQTIGRLTSTHTAAAWGMALIVGAAFTCIARTPHSRVLRWSLSALGLVAFVGMLSYDQWIQREYVRSWGLQRGFWRQVLQLTPEADGGYSILITGHPFPTSPVMYTNSWADTLVFKALLADRPNQEPIYLAHLGTVGGAIKFRKEDDVILWNPEFWSGNEVRMNPDKLIILSFEGSQLNRIAELPTPVGTLRTTQPPAAVPVRRRQSKLATIMFPEDSGRDH